MSMDVPKELRYSAEHEWVVVEEGIARVGITDYAQDQLGDVVYVELPEVETAVQKEEPFGVIESVKAVSDLFSPMSGTVVEVNIDLPSSPEMVNDDPYGDAWMIRIQVSEPDELEDLMDAEEYLAFVEQERADRED
jgi:glycine cleavage system H protein